MLQLLPGPEAHELCVHLGMIARGRLGGLVAGIGFMLPGFALMLASGWLYTTFVSGSADFGRVFLGVQIVVLAIIARAVARIGHHIVKTRLLALIAGVTFVLSLLAVPFWILLLACGIAYAAPDRNRSVVVAGLITLTIAAAGFLTWPPTTNAAIIAAGPVSMTALFLAGLKGGLLTFGGAYIAIPYVRSDTVGRGWISDPTFLDGIAIAGVLPAPLVIFVTFVGYIVGGISGACAITLGMFLPAFAFSLIFFERLEAVIENPALHRLLEGIAASVLGIIAATLFELAQTSNGRIANPWPAAVLCASALVTVWSVKKIWITPVVILAGAATGWLVGL